MVNASTSLPNFSLNYSSVCVHFFLQKDTKNTKYQLGKANLQLDGGAGKPVHAGGGPHVDSLYRERPGAEAQAATALRVLRFAGQGHVL